MRRPILPLCVALCLLAGCQKPPPATASVAFDPLAFFAGHTHSRGMMEDRSGAPTGWVVTDSHAEPDAAGRLRMFQHLTFQDAPAQDRQWLLWTTGPGHFEATANDMVGTAKGSAEGGVFHWRWVLARSPGNALMNVTMNQWMYRMDDGSAMVRTTISKMGIIAAEVTEQFVRG